MSDFWLDKPSILVDPDKLFDFFPSKNDSIALQMNSIVRFSFYLSVVLSSYNKNYNYFYIMVIVMAITVLVYKKEGLENTLVEETVPTMENPVMNFTMADILNVDEEENIKERPPIQDPLDPKVAKEIDRNLSLGSYRDVSDIFNKNSSQRQFFTMPWTDVVNDRHTFQNWLYKTGDTCKETSCLRYEDIRQKSPIFPNEYDNPTRSTR
jgi:hypothetical protein